MENLKLLISIIIPVSVIYIKIWWDDVEKKNQDATSELNRMQYFKSLLELVSIHLGQIKDCYINVLNHKVDNPFKLSPKVVIQSSSLRRIIELENVVSYFVSLNKIYLSPNELEEKVTNLNEVINFIEWCHLHYQEYYNYHDECRQKEEIYIQKFEDNILKIRKVFYQYGHNIHIENTSDFSPLVNELKTYYKEKFNQSNNEIVFLFDEIDLLLDKLRFNQNNFANSINSDIPILEKELNNLSVFISDLTRSINIYPKPFKGNAIEKMKHYIND